MLTVPAPLAELGMDQELKAALLKLSAALPASRRTDEAKARQRVHLDPDGWLETEEPVPHLQAIHSAIWDNRRLQIVYRLPFQARAEWLVEPYGLVAKASTWHLVCFRDGHPRVYRVSRILNARICDETFVRDRHFDLSAYWRSWCAGVEANRPSYPVTVRVAPAFVPWLQQLFGHRMRDEIAQAQPPDARGWIRLTLTFETLEDARDRILSFGRAVEVLEPEALRNSVLDFAQQTVALYAN
jgi:predicted DNA-binding transcriptional regulator YafY